MINHDEPSIFNTNEDGEWDYGVGLCGSHGGYLWLTHKELGVGKGGLSQHCSRGMSAAGIWCGEGGTLDRAIAS